MINRSAVLIGTLKFGNGNQTRLWIGSNSNTGETILWQETLYNGQAAYGKAHRITGKNIKIIVNEINFVLKEGEAVWIERPTDSAFDALQRLL